MQRDSHRMAADCVILRQECQGPNRVSVKLIARVVFPGHSTKLKDNAGVWKPSSCCKSLNEFAIRIVKYKIQVIHLKTDASNFVNAYYASNFVNSF